MTLKTDKYQLEWDYEYILAQLRHAASTNDWSLVNHQIRRLEQLQPEVIRGAQALGARA